MTSPHPGDRVPVSDGGIQVRGVGKRFANLAALCDVSLCVDPGEILALVGPNGAGKSTLVRILATTVIPDHGRADVAGHDVVGKPALARKAVGLVLGDDRSFYPRLTGRQNLEFFAALHGLGRRAAAARSVEVMVKVGLDGGVGGCGAGSSVYQAWSAGMKSRLSLARALLGGPSVLLLDEPTSHLDPGVACSIRELISQFAHSHGMAVLLVTHDMHEAAALASRVAVLAAGRLIDTLDGPVAVSTLERSLAAAPTGPHGP